MGSLARQRAVSLLQGVALCHVWPQVAPLVPDDNAVKLSTGHVAMIAHL